MARSRLDELLVPNQSPYFGMFRAGLQGYSIEEVEQHCLRYCIPLREKDIRSWEDGHFKHEMHSEEFQHRLQILRATPGYYINPVVQKIKPEHIGATVNYQIARKNNFDEVKLEDFARLPEGWRGTERRYFPCSAENRPMCAWGWKQAETHSGTQVRDPGLMSIDDAKALSPVQWVGQNMLYQPFIVMDIDGVGHGCTDWQVIEFGNLFKDSTLSYEDPTKPGSFHLYFRTNRIIPVKHFPHAKLDLMGNAVNAAVYMKNKVSNGKPMMELDSYVWDAMMEYQKGRKEKECHSTPQALPTMVGTTATRTSQAIPLCS